jgi:hypothetical protein
MRKRKSSTGIAFKMAWVLGLTALVLRTIIDLLLTKIFPKAKTTMRFAFNTVKVWQLIRTVLWNITNALLIKMWRWLNITMPPA